MIPKFANPHSQIHGLEPVSRAQLKSDADGPSDTDHDAADVEVTTYKRKLHDLLLSELGECLSGTAGHTSRKKRRLGEGGAMPPSEEDGMILFRLLSSAGPKIISTAPKPPPPPKTRPPDYEDDPVKADERMRRAQSVAVDSAWLQKQQRSEPCAPPVQHDRKHVHVQGTLPNLHPAVMVTECHRHQEARRQTLAGASDSPHSLVTKCTVLPIRCLPLRHDPEPRARGKRKRSYERPPPGYWRPDSTQRGKCLGYALGYPGNWSVRYEGDPRKRWYVRDVMRKGASTV